MSDKILKENEKFERIISELKKNSCYYPSVLMKCYENTLYCSTLVRINRNNKWYVVHCVESIMPTKIITERHLLLRMMESVHKIEFLYKTTGVFEVVDGLQQGEVERLLEFYNGAFEKKSVVQEKCNFEQDCVHKSEEIERYSDGFVYEACFKCGRILNV